MKITYMVAHRDAPPNYAGWEETYEHDGSDATEIISALIANFNATLKPGEMPRRLVRIVSIEATAPKPIVLEHRWHKQNLVTISRRGRLFDEMKCERCGATGKRYGLGHVTLDPKFDKPKFRHCPGCDL